MKYKLFSLLENYYDCLHGGWENKNSIPVVSKGATQLTRMQLASINMKNQSSSGYKRETMKKYIDHESDTESLDFETTAVDPYSHDRKEVHRVIPTNIFGSEEFKSKLQSLCRKYIDIFSTKLNENPADILPFEIQCDKNKWLTNKKNQLPPRVQSPEKQAETLKQITDMLKNKIIKPSEATVHSQVLLVPKPNQKWRFCIDFRNLNAPVGRFPISK
jgi:hypothetical protein